jgi:hypothetical protein
VQYIGNLNQGKDWDIIEENYQQEGRKMSRRNQVFPAIRVSVTILGLLCFICSPRLAAADQEKAGISNRVVTIEAIVVEADSPILNPTTDALRKAAGKDLSDLILPEVPKASSLRERLLAAEEKCMLRILASPVFMSQIGEELQFLSGEQIPVSTVANFTVTTRYVNATLELRLTCHVDSNLIRMDTEFQYGFPRWEVPPQKRISDVPDIGHNIPLNSESAHISLTVRDGGTAVISGIYQIRDDEGKKRRGPELILFLTPKLVTL